MQTPIDKKNSETSSSSSKEERLSDYFQIILMHRRFIGYTVGAALIVSLLVSMLLPNVYIAKASILPPQDDNHGLATLLSNSDDPLSGLAGSLIGSKTPAALYIGILKSRSVADALTQKFDLQKRYGEKYIEDVHKELADRSFIELSKKDNLISVTVEDRDPQRAADMANAYVKLLDQFNRKLNITQGKRKRIFLEGRLKEVRKDMEKAEVDLKRFQEKYHLVSIDEQAKAAIKGAAEIKGEIIAAQTELEVFKQFGTERQIEAVTLKAKINELQKQLERIEQGHNFESNKDKPSLNDKASNFYIPFKEIPHLGLQLMRFTREAKIQEKLFELLTAQYEIARIEEAKDVDTVQVLDPAVAPEKRIRPKRIRIIVVSTLISLIGAVVIVFSRRYYHKFTI